MLFGPLLRGPILRQSDAISWRKEVDKVVKFLSDRLSPISSLHSIISPPLPISFLFLLAHLAKKQTAIETRKRNSHWFLAKQEKKTISGGIKHSLPLSSEISSAICRPRQQLKSASTLLGITADAEAEEIIPSQRECMRKILCPFPRAKKVIDRGSEE